MATGLARLEATAAAALLLFIGASYAMKAPGSGGCTNTTPVFLQVLLLVKRPYITVIGLARPSMAHTQPECFPIM